MRDQGGRTVARLRWPTCAVSFCAVDADLVALARAAEEGRKCPEVYLLLAGNIMLVGTPFTRGQFWQMNEEYYRKAVESNLRRHAGRRVKKDEKPEVLSEVIDPLQATIDSVKDASSDGDSPSALCLWNARWMPLGGGTGVQVDALRVPLDSVAAWWVHGAREVKDTNFSFFIGAVVPIGGD